MDELLQQLMLMQNPGPLFEGMHILGDIYTCFFDNYIITLLAF